MDVQTFFRVLNHHWSSGLGLKLNRNSVGENWNKKAKSLILTVCSWVTLFKIKTLHVCLPGQIMKLTMLVMPNSWRQVSMNLLDLRSWKQKKWLFGPVTAHKTNRSIRLEVCNFLAWFSRLSKKKKKTLNWETWVVSGWRLFAFLSWELWKDECVLSLHSSVWEALLYRCLHALTGSESLGFASAWEKSGCASRCEKKTKTKKPEKSSSARWFEFRCHCKVCDLTEEFKNGGESHKTVEAVCHVVDTWGWLQA